MSPINALIYRGYLYISLFLTLIFSYYTDLCAFILDSQVSYH